MAVLGVLCRFLPAIELRAGVVLPDPVLARLGPADASGLLFVLIYGVVVVGLVVLIPRPRALLAAAQAYTLILVVRMATLALVPLECPPSTIPLRDPLIELYVRTSEPLRDDLFFSGHVATATLLVLATREPRLRAFFAVVACAIGGLLLRQHVHYTIDVVAAPFFALGCWRAVQAARRCKSMRSRRF